MATRGLPERHQHVVGPSGTGGPVVGLRRTVMIGVNGFAAATAIGGGLALASGWEADRFPRAWLSGTPCNTYLVPGVLLAGVVGGSAGAATLTALRGAPSAERMSMIAGSVLIGWIGIEIVVLPAPARSWTELLCLGTGLVMCTLGRGRRRNGRRPGTATQRSGSGSSCSGRP